MYALMSYQIALLTECLITQITGISTLTTMYAMMCYLIAPTNERFITHITNIRALTRMYALMCYQIAVYIMLFIRSTLVKIQRPNIRIYSDRNSNYFYSNVYSK